MLRKCVEMGIILTALAVIKLTECLDALLPVSPSKSKPAAAVCQAPKDQTARETCSFHNPNPELESLGKAQQQQAYQEEERLSCSQVATSAHLCTQNQMEEEDNKNSFHTDTLSDEDSATLEDSLYEEQSLEQEDSRPCTPTSRDDASSSSSSSNSRSSSPLSSPRSSFRACSPTGREVTRLWAHFEEMARRQQYEQSVVQQWKARWRVACADARSASSCSAIGRRVQHLVVA
eukprot:jgi/Chlat1/6545/Chrsp45S06011